MKPFVILAAPSGSGKTTIVKRLLAEMPVFKFSISATTRPARSTEKDGVDYHFISVDDFQAKIDDGEFIEWEMVYEGKYYGTLKSEIDRIYSLQKVPLLDIDVVGAINIKNQYQGQALTVFIKPPSIAVLQQRLEHRGTDASDIIQERVAKAAHELSFEPAFDLVIVNDDLDTAVHQLKEALKQRLEL